ncbi:DUF2946 domain-containing protein [Reyranella sp.]|uniref:DUF2946 domain-containing protein n=1 Tax=Reyranella sp. TaxID=1929291 RepID=UPI003D1387FC
MLRHNRMMYGGKDGSGKALALLAALFAVTLNFLQPVIHGALMRDGAPGALWRVLCQETTADPERKPTPASPDTHLAHDCCLGLAHAVPLALPSLAFVVVPPVVTKFAASLPHEISSSVGIRDGPRRPRGPPSIG